MRIDVITIFPAYLDVLHLSLVGKAVEAGIIDLNVTDLRDFADDRHRTVDDAPYGGGPGMVMLPTIWGAALDAAAADRGPSSADLPRLIIPTPSGRPFTQRMAEDLAADPWLVFACGRYEGIDARVAEYFRRDPSWRGVDEVSIGDYVLAGGEAATVVMVEAIARLIPGVLGNPRSAHEDSFQGSGVEGPQFTRPLTWRGITVPEVLRSGNHAQIAEHQARMARERTARFRPDLTDPTEQTGAP